MSRLTTLAVVLLVPLAGRSDPPVFVKIEEREGKLAAQVTTTKYQSVQQAVTVVENGAPVTRTVTRVVPVTVTEYRVLTAEAGDFFTPTGDRLDPKKLSDVLKKGAVLAVSRDGKSVDPEAVKTHKEVVAVLVPKGVAVVQTEPMKALADEAPFAADATLMDGAVVFDRYAVVNQEVPIQEKRALPGGKVETVTVKKKIPITRREAVSLDPKRTQVLRLDGTVVPPAEWAGLFKGKTKVFVSPGGKAVPDELRAANKDAVAVVVIKPGK